MGCNVRDSVPQDARHECSLCEKTAQNDGNKEDKLLEGKNLATSSFWVFIFPLIAAVIASSTQESETKKIIAALLGFSFGVISAKLLTKSILQKALKMRLTNVS